MCARPSSRVLENRPLFYSSQTRRELESTSKCKLVIPAIQCDILFPPLYIIIIFFRFTSMSSDVACKSAARHHPCRRMPTFGLCAAPSSPKRSNSPISSSKSRQVNQISIYMIDFYISTAVLMPCLCLFPFFFTTLAPEDWRELRTKSENHSQELTGLHLADWVKTSLSFLKCSETLGNQ